MLMYYFMPVQLLLIMIRMGTMQCEVMLNDIAIDVGR